jgi:hypothetical protein
MAVDIEYLESRGVSSKEYKRLFTLAPPDRPPKLDQLIRLLRDRSRRGRDANLRDYRIYAAIDLAYALPFNQTTPTIVQSIVSKKLSPEKIKEALKSWGLSEEELFLKVEVDGVTKMVPNPPVFFQILVPLVKAYTTIRAAKLYNDRNQRPLFVFNALKNTDDQRVQCEIVTDWIETISTNYGYPAHLRSCITHALKYGVALCFPREEWHCDEQIMQDGGRPVVTTEREGLRYILPHPTQQFWDLEYPLTTINTDTGIMFSGHWRAMRYGDVMDNRKYWNRKSITFGSKWWNEPLWLNFFNEVYPCQMAFPQTTSSGTELREDRLTFYSNGDRDQGIFVTEIFAKIVPSQWGLGDYKYPVWHRFTLANDDTVIWAAPCAYNPCWMMGYDYDDQSARQSSFALEAIPWQDHLGNLLSQLILTTKQNLSNVIFYDTNLVSEDDITQLKNSGEQRYRAINFIPYDSLKMMRSGMTPRSAFESVNFTFRDTSQLAQAMAGALNIMERVLQMSAQEVGATAQHYQSAKEIAVTQNATTNRLSFTGSFIDDGIDAWKRQLFDASKSYADADIIATIEAEVTNLQEIVERIGFHMKGVHQGKAFVTGRKHSIKLEGFTRSDNTPYRESNSQLAQIIYQTVGAVSGNEQLLLTIGAPNILKLLEQAALLAGAPRDFRLRVDPNSTPGGIKAIVAQGMQQVGQTIMQTVQKDIAAPAAELAAKQDQRLTQIESVMQQLQKIYDVAAAQMDKAKAAAAEAQQRMQIKQAEFEAEQTRKQQAHQLDMERKSQLAQGDVAIRTATTQVDTQLKLQQAQADAAAAQARADSEAAAQRSQATAEIDIQQQQADQERRITEERADQDLQITARKAEADIAVKKAQAKAVAKAKPAKSGGG